jgi:SET domain-containing protein
MEDNPWVWKARSGIHGGGLFARCDIPRGTRIIEYVGPRLTKAQSRKRSEELMEQASLSGDGAVYIFELNQRYDIDGSVSWNLARFINHSCQPNCEPVIVRGKIWIVSLRRIPAGGELLYNYGYDLDHWQDHPCRCGSERCVGFIVARRFWRKLERLKGGSLPRVNSANGKLPA